MKTAYDIIKRILRTEKGTLYSQKQNKYFFDVDLKSNKLEIKKAVEEIYKVKVTRVNTQVVAGKPKTLRLVEGHRSDWKKAIVSLAEGQKIELAQ